METKLGHTHLKVNKGDVVLLLGSLIIQQQMTSIVGVPHRPTNVFASTLSLVFLIAIKEEVLIFLSEEKRHNSCMDGSRSFSLIP